LELAVLVYLVPSLVSAVLLGIVGIMRQRRLRARDRMAFELGRHIFDQTRSPTVLSDLASFEPPGAVLNIKPAIQPPPDSS